MSSIHLWFRSLANRAIVAAVVLLPLMVGCQHRSESPVIPIPEGIAAPAPTSTGNASLNFKISLDGTDQTAELLGALRAASDTASNTTAATVTITLVTLNVGVTTGASTATQTREVSVVNGEASATFTGLPAQPVFATVEIASGSYRGCDRFRGALDLATGTNALVAVPRGSRFARDVTAHVIERMISDGTSIRRANRTLVATVDAAVAQLTRDNDYVYTTAYEAMRRRLNSSLANNTPPGAPAITDVVAATDVGTGSDSQVLHANPMVGVYQYRSVDPDSGDQPSWADFEIYDVATPTAGHLVWVNSTCTVSLYSPMSVTCEVSTASGSFRNAWTGRSKIPGYRTPFWLRARFHDNNGGIGSWSEMRALTSDYGPTFAWQVLLGGSENDYGTGILPAADGNGVVVSAYGMSLPGGTGYMRDFSAIYQLDANGNKLWQRFYGGNSYSNGGGGTSDVTVSDIIRYGSGYGVLCHSTADTVDFVGNDWRTGYSWFLKVGAGGEDLGKIKFPGNPQQTYDMTLAANGTVFGVGVAINGSSQFMTIPQTGSGSAEPVSPTSGGGTFTPRSVVAGHGDTVDLRKLYMAGSQRPTGQTHDRMFFRELTTTLANWEEDWDSDEFALRVVKAPDNCYLVLSETNSGNVPGWHGGGEIVVTKLRVTDTTVDKVWQVTLGGDGAETARRIRVTSDGGCIILGTTESNPSSSSTGPKGGLLGASSQGLKRQLWLVKLDSSGNVQWQKVLGGGWGSSGWGAQAGDVAQLPDGGYAVTGANNAGLLRPNGTSADSRLFDVWVVRLDP